MPGLLLEYSPMVLPSREARRGEGEEGGTASILPRGLSTSSSTFPDLAEAVFLIIYRSFTENLSFGKNKKHEAKSFYIMFSTEKKCQTKFLQKRKRVILNDLSS
jgi:hypothetical protein